MYTELIYLKLNVLYVCYWLPDGLCKICVINGFYCATKIKKMLIMLFLSVLNYLDIVELVDVLFRINFIKISVDSDIKIVIGSQCYFYRINIFSYTTPPHVSEQKHENCSAFLISNKHNYIIVRLIVRRVKILYKLFLPLIQYCDLFI